MTNNFESGIRRISTLNKRDQYSKNDPLCASERIPSKGRKGKDNK